VKKQHHGNVTGVAQNNLQLISLPLHLPGYQQGWHISIMGDGSLKMIVPRNGSLDAQT